MASFLEETMTNAGTAAVETCDRHRVEKEYEMNDFQGVALFTERRGQGSDELSIVPTSKSSIDGEA
jgi:hypothetical protein